MEKRIEVGNLEILHKLFGNLDENIKGIEGQFNVQITSRDGEVLIVGEEEEERIKVENLIYNLIDALKSGELIDRQKLDYYIQAVKEGDTEHLGTLNDSIVCITARGKMIKPKTSGQKKYIDDIKNHDVTIGVGPAGTGKTYLAVAMAVKSFKAGEVNRIVITRPAVEAGESLGFLPGDLQMKVDPYLRPLYDALYDILGSETYLKYKDRGLIEIAPLAYMRGRTLDNSFIILDEAQNTTKEQMKMFLTRFGFGSKVVINGDVTQIDLPGGKKSGLVNAVEVLRDVNEISICKFTNRDVVRHHLVKKIIASYERYEAKQKYKKDREQSYKKRK